MNTKVNEIQISYREIPAVIASNKITCSNDAYLILKESWDQNTIGLQESFRVLLLNNASQVKGIFELSRGGITGTLVDIRILLAVALKSLSTGIILAHNHPSGKVAPSKADRQITRKIQKAAKYLDIRVLDHLIVTPGEAYFSFADENLL